MSVSSNRTMDEVAVRELVEDWARAVRAKDLKGILANHSSTILMFDVPPPLQSKGIEAVRPVSWTASTPRLCGQRLTFRSARKASGA